MADPKFDNTRAKQITMGQDVPMTPAAPEPAPVAEIAAEPIVEEESHVDQV